MDPLVDRALAAARARGIDVREHLGNTSYCQRWAVGDALVLRIPLIAVADDETHGAGPMLESKNRNIAQLLLDSTTDRQRGVDRGPLARFVDRIDLDGVGVTLHERAVGHAPARGDIPAVARALAELHDVLGYHGHLVPAHIFVDGAQVTFTDPLPAYPFVLGAIGYDLPIAAQALEPHDEGRLLRDVVAMIAITAELCDCDLGWNASFIEFFERWGNTGVRGPWHVSRELEDFYLRTQTIGDPILRGWVDAAARLVLDHYIPAPSVRPESAAPRPATPGIAKSLLTRFDLHAALGAIAARIERSPSLFDFVELERARAIGVTPTADDYETAFAARDASFAQLAGALDEIQRAYGDPPAVPVPVIVHPTDVYAESHELRTLLLDVDKLLHPVPETLSIAGGLLTRARSSLAALAADEDKRYMAARRYVNYVAR